MGFCDFGGGGGGLISMANLREVKFGILRVKIMMQIGLTQHLKGLIKE